MVAKGCKHRHRRADLQNRSHRTDSLVELAPIKDSVICIAHILYEDWSSAQVTPAQNCRRAPGMLPVAI